MGWGAVGTANNPLSSVTGLVGSYAGQQIWVVNPAVPRGRSRLEWTGTIWAPPAGELIAGIWGGTNPVALVTPGATALTQIYASPVIPDYMLPDGVVFAEYVSITAKNAAGASGCVLGVGICGAVPTGVTSGEYPNGASVTPDSTGIGTPTAYAGFGKRKAATFYNSTAITAGRSIEASTCGPFNAGACKLYAMAKPSAVGDQIRFDGASVISMGAL